MYYGDEISWQPTEFGMTMANRNTQQIVWNWGGEFDPSTTYISMRGISLTDAGVGEGNAVMTDYPSLGASMGNFGLADVAGSAVGLAFALAQLWDTPVPSPPSNPNYNSAGVTYGDAFYYSLNSDTSFLPGINSPFDQQPTVAQQVLSAYGVQWNFSEDASTEPNPWDINVMPSSLGGTGAAQFLANANNPFINNTVNLPSALSANSDITPVSNWQADPMYLWTLGYDPVYQVAQPTVVNVIGSIGPDDMAPLLFSEPDYTPSDYQLTELPLDNLDYLSALLPVVYTPDSPFLPDSPSPSQTQPQPQPSYQAQSQSPFQSLNWGQDAAGVPVPDYTSPYGWGSSGYIGSLEQGDDISGFIDSLTTDSMTPATDTAGQTADDSGSDTSTISGGYDDGGTDSGGDGGGDDGGGYDPGDEGGGGGGDYMA